MYNELPPDPFANDPNDPANLFDDFSEPAAPPLTPEDFLALHNDLQSVAEFKKLLRPRGIEGVFFYCEDCEEIHYFDWDIIESNLKATIANSLAPVHEPSVEPDPNRYVPWDYALGYLHGLQDTN
ncbi:Uncharacterised protein [Corynebacterium renale]|uniref:DUF5319 domain-containing protein n=1 Tax=Corynebacterium renale TaxID=1724 RepID=UPI000DA37980|nr:DUF5319 domain-containing protein [Corynebacterium renale]SQG64097.1 Uncharacterised protein [Corynebacterium renale]STC94320.1 Uncharacterised protein [Corynebacterium renale]